MYRADRAVEPARLAQHADADGEAGERAIAGRGAEHRNLLGWIGGAEEAVLFFEQLEGALDVAEGAEGV